MKAAQDWSDPLALTDTDGSHMDVKQERQNEKNWHQAL